MQRKNLFDLLALKEKVASNKFLQRMQPLKEEKIKVEKYQHIGIRFPNFLVLRNPTKYFFLSLSIELSSTNSWGGTN